MSATRQPCRDRRLWTGWLIALALLAKMLVPAGFMPVFSTDGVTIELCTGFGPQKMVVAIPGTAHRDGKPMEAHADMPCAFAGLAAPSLAATDAAVALVAIAFILRIARHVATRDPGPAPPFLRPPSRGPPVRS